MSKSPTMEEIVEDMKQRIGILIEQGKIKEKYRESNKSTNDRQEHISQN